VGVRSSDQNTSLYYPSQVVPPPISYHYHHTPRSSKLRRMYLSNARSFVGSVLGWLVEKPYLQICTCRYGVRGFVGTRSSDQKLERVCVLPSRRYALGSDVPLLIKCYTGRGRLLPQQCGWFPVPSSWGGEE